MSSPPCIPPPPQGITTPVYSTSPTSPPDRPRPHGLPTFPGIPHSHEMPHPFVHGVPHPLVYHTVLIFKIPGTWQRHTSMAYHIPWSTTSSWCTTNPGEPHPPSVSHAMGSPTHTMGYHTVGTTTLALPPPSPGRQTPWFSLILIWLSGIPPRSSYFGV